MPPDAPSTVPRYYVRHVAAIKQLDQLLDPKLEEVVSQWRSIHDRQPYEELPRQTDFVPVEVILCHGASMIVDHRRYGSSTAESADEPTLLLAQLFRRPPSSVLAKMANLDGSRSNGGKFDRAVGSVWSVDPSRFGRAYAVTLLGARRAGFGDSALPDFLSPGWSA